MDPLSVTASVAGLLTAANEVAKLLGPYVSASRETPSIAAHVRDEAESTRTVLVGLQTLVRELSGRFSPGGALVGVDQVVAILTSGVLLFAELEGAVQRLVPSSPSLIVEGESTDRIPGVLELSSMQHRLPLRARMQWARQEESLKSLLARLQGFKVSVTAVLTLLQCDSDRRAQQLQMELAANVGALLSSNRELSQRMMHLEGAFDMQTIRSRQSIVSVLATARTEAGERFTLAPPPGETTSLAPESVIGSAFEFESDLETSRVYRRAQRDTVDFSFRSSVARTHAWSMLSGYSLADISVLSVIALPLDLEDIANRHHYIDANDAPVAEEELSAPKSEPSLAEEGSIFHDCLRIHSQLLQIPGWQELFNKQWLAQCQEKRVDVHVFAQVDDNRERVWQQLDVFRALKGIFLDDMGYRWLPKEPIFQRSSRSTSQEVSYLFQLLYIDLGFSPKRLSWNNDILLEDNVYFLEILACLSKHLERLSTAWPINHIEEDDLDALVSSVRESSLFPESAYRQALEKFVHDQRLFVRNLLGLISASEKVTQDSSPMLVPDQFHITNQLLSSYASSEIELLLTVERMLLAPPYLHLWAAAVRQWSVTAETHRKSMMIQEQKARRVLQGALSSERGNSLIVQRDRTLVTSCLELLSKPLQMFPRTAHFFQEILGMLPGDFAGIEAISPAQKDDFIESKRLVKYTLRIARGEVRQSELSQALQDLVLRVEDWKNLRVERFGRLIRVDNLSKSTGQGYNPIECHVYLFEDILLCLVERKLAAEIRPESFMVAGTVEAGDATDKPYKLLMKGRIFLKHIRDVHCHIQPNSYEAQIWWQSYDRGVETTWFCFTSEWQMVEWCRSLIELIRSHHQPSTTPNPLDALLFVQTQAAAVSESVKPNSGSKIKLTSLSARSQLPLSRPPYLRDRRLLLSPPREIETSEESITGQGDSSLDDMGLAV
ncbi:hypothetical protein F4782DRAFT_530027 [Xylaria castorea]|nr:hypothetical protein F4782DRAFT_530027 [Xylaria castorea]